MGGIFGRKKTQQFDPNQYPFNDPFNDPFAGGGFGAPPPYPPYPPGGYGASPLSYTPSYDPGGGLGYYDPYENYGYDPTYSMESYGGTLGSLPNYYGGRRGRGKFDR